LYIPKEYKLPKVVDEDYGMDWPSNQDGSRISQITIELAGFSSNGKRGKFESRFRHGLRLVRMLWPNEVLLYKSVKNWRTGEHEIVWNNYFMDAFEACCNNNRVSLTGCASSGKTFAVAVYCLLLFMSDPIDTTIMVSTTAGTDAERRIWGEIKVLHSALSETYPLGTLIEYLKCITFDPQRELTGKENLDFKRDLGSGIIVIPIPKGGEGEKALGKVIGTKNAKIVWVIDEMPHMMDGVLRPESNLEYNAFYQLIVIGNANRKTDPHGKISEPADGWDSVSVDSDTWFAGDDTKVVFLHGARGPNFHPAVNPEETDKNSLPFPYLSNRISMENVALRNGYGATREERIANGKLTIDFMRFAIGFWYGDDISQVIISESYVKEHGADDEMFSWSHKPRTKIAGFDPSFTSGGDKNSLMFGEFGEDSHGSQIINVDRENIGVRGVAESRESFRREIAKQVVDRCTERGVLPENFFMDISGDGGLMAIEIMTEWSESLDRQVKIQGISSLEKTGDEEDRYYDIVTKLWFQVQKAIATGRMRGFNCRSSYAKDLFERRYESVGKGVVRIEPKGNKKNTAGSGFKSRMGRSPDDGDSFVYMIEGAKKRGFSLKKDPEKPRNTEMVDRLRRRLEGFEPQLTDAYAGIGHEEAASADESWSQEASWN
jgi:hypothetical protein